ncbi:hypothetical protein [Clostridium botulinum]|uniref:hypothetical protein n=1 Tax=Clostridium botulinum TaxID=1491 RepID=UPI000463ECC6|nr:hypothetical protein [Clostridium botulinum]APH20894.1 hypothetical protein NPD1_4122 [Clostridium botulinum]APQ71152.1 hypothetical protein RSJ8_4079 [Clostridium botulinum]APR02447.1 hypothetical protein RSJ2_3934 [Clostridium botulinum]MBN3352047.1 hypothetical protein [Clostridium botulinum]MBN3367265.1 hypothetical protein [Clostridium botulinum]
MNFTSNIFQIEHSNVLSLIPITVYKNDDEINEFIKTINKLDLDVNDFYKVEGKLYKYCYLKDTVLVEIYDISEDYFINFKVEEQMKQREEIHKKCIENKEYIRLFCLIDKPYRLLFYEELFNDIPDEQKYKVFKNIYTSSEYGFNNLSREFLEEIFEYNEVNKNWFDKDIITIYRGEGDMSTPYDEAYSWTIDIDVAKWFAERFNDNGKVYNGKVYKGYIRQEDILDYIEDRNEKEILVFPEDVFDVEQIL